MQIFLRYSALRRATIGRKQIRSSIALWLYLRNVFYMSNNDPSLNVESDRLVFATCQPCQLKELEMILPYYFSDPDRSVSRTCKPSPMSIRRISRQTTDEPTPNNERTFDEHGSDGKQTTDDQRSLWVEFDFRTSRIVLSKSLYAHLLAEETKHVDFLFAGRSCYVTRSEPGKGLLCTGVRSISVRHRHKPFIEQMRLAWERTSDERLRVEVSPSSVAIPGLDTSIFPEPIYSLIV